MQCPGSGQCASGRDWELHYNWIPTGADENGTNVFIWPGMAITARHRQTGEVRKTSIPGEALYARKLGPNPFQKAFEEIGLWELLEKGSPRHYLISARKPPGWPMYTRFIVPQLYEFMAPYYSRRGHYSEKTNQPTDYVNSRFPKELLQDMLGILQIEHPHVFAKTTVNQLKANIQRHLARKPRSTKSVSKP